MTPLDHELLSDRIYAMLRGRIQSSSLQPGEQLIESQLARELRVSQSPVGGGVRRLSHDGLVTQIRHQGSFVANFSDAEAEAARDARVALEELAGRFVCGHLDPSVRANLERCIQEMASAASEPDLYAFRELDFEFHRAIVSASGNVYLPRMWDVIEPSLRSLHVLSNPDFCGDWQEVTESHRVLLDALEAGDPDRAASLFRAHAGGHGGLARQPMDGARR